MLFFEQDFCNFFHRIRDGMPKRMTPDFRTALDAVNSFHRIVRSEEKRDMPPKLRKALEGLVARKGIGIRSTALSSIPGAPELWERLQHSRSKNDVRRIARKLESFPLFGGVLPRLLRERPEELFKARHHSLWPRRDDKRTDFLARWFAGIASGIPGQRAVEHLRKMKHGRKCLCWRCLRGWSSK